MCQKMIKRKNNIIVMRYKIKKYLILIFSFGLIFYSCKNEKANPEFIERLSSIENGLPSPYFNYYLYFKTDDDKLIETNITFYINFIKIIMMKLIKIT